MLGKRDPSVARFGFHSFLVYIIHKTLRGVSSASVSISCAGLSHLLRRARAFLGGTCSGLRGRWRAVAEKSSLNDGASETTIVTSFTSFVFFLYLNLICLVEQVQVVLHLSEAKSLWCRGHWSRGGPLGSFIRNPGQEMVRVLSWLGVIFNTYLASQLNLFLQISLR